MTETTERSPDGAARHPAHARVRRLEEEWGRGPEHVGEVGVDHAAVADGRHPAGGVVAHDRFDRGHHGALEGHRIALARGPLAGDELLPPGVARASELLDGDVGVRIRSHSASPSSTWTSTPTAAPPGRRSLGPDAAGWCRPGPALAGEPGGERLGLRQPLRRQPRIGGTGGGFDALCMAVTNEQEIHRWLRL